MEYHVLLYNLKIDCLSLAESCFQSTEYDVHWLGHAFQRISVSKFRYQLLVTSPVVTPTSARAFYINGVWCWLFLPQLSREKTNYIIKQLLTIEVLDMMLISSIEYQYWTRTSPQSILVFSGEYQVISNTSIVNNCIMCLRCDISVRQQSKSEYWALPHLDNVMIWLQ